MNPSCQLPIYNNISESDKNMLAKIVANKCLDDICENRYLKVRKILSSNGEIKIKVVTNVYIYRAFSQIEGINITEPKFGCYTRTYAKFGLMKGFFKNFRKVKNREIDLDREIKIYTFYIKL